MAFLRFHFSTPTPPKKSPQDLVKQLIRVRPKARDKQIDTLSKTKEGRSQLAKALNYIDTLVSKNMLSKQSALNTVCTVLSSQDDNVTFAGAKIWVEKALGEESLAKYFDGSQTKIDKASHEQLMQACNEFDTATDNLEILSELDKLMRPKAYMLETNSSFTKSM